MKSIKEILVNQLCSVLDKRIETANRDIQLAIESRDNETKSTAGDKYETGRAMVQFELEKSNVQLIKAFQLKKELTQIDLLRKSDKVTFGSVVKTNTGIYFISIGLGKISIEEETFFAVSLASPLGKILNNKKKGEEFIFQENKNRIVEIL